MVIRRLLGYLKPHRKALSGAFLILLLATTADLAGPILVKQYIDNYLTPGIVEARPLFYLGSLYLALQIASVLLHYFQLLAFNRIALDVIFELRVQVFNKVQQLGLQFFDQTPVGWVVSRITNDTQAIKNLFVDTLSTFVQSIVFLAGTFVAFFLLDQRLALYYLILLPLLIALIQGYRYFSSIVYRLIRQLLSSINTKVNETLQNINICQAFRQENIIDDVKWCKENGKSYAPTVFPGFSWYNMKDNEISDKIPRNKGEFYWKQIAGAIESGAEMIYVAMFDEIDEGTAIMKCAHNVPVGKSIFVPIEKEVPSDHYLWLTGMAGKILRGEIPFSKTMPVRKN